MGSVQEADAVRDLSAELHPIRGAVEDVRKDICEILQGANGLQNYRGHFESPRPDGFSDRRIERGLD